MPEFEMPAEVSAPPRPEPAQPATERPAHTAEPGASDRLEAPRPVRAGWRRLIAAGVIGALLGAALPGALQLVERRAAAADTESLRTVAADYLAAIAEGRAAEATAMVPLPQRAETATDAVLQSADRIEDAAVRLVHIDGDAGLVEVAFTLLGEEHARSLSAERVFGEWRLTTPLAEPLDIGMFSNAVAAIGGFELPRGGVHLYPARYSFDRQTGPVVQVRGEPFVVDGDPASQTMAYVEAVLVPDVAAAVNTMVAELAEVCQRALDCPVPAGADVRTPNVYISNVGERSIDLMAQVATSTGQSEQWFDVMVRAELGDTGAAQQWLCSSIGSFSTPTEPCPAPPTD
ncbi:hypothetical protein SAMN04489719_1065 [Agrococcus carbonis]|uniref:DUF4878 domain-containing protein n=2 Tax=Agrococcus carbonis TaxID=684552 RepID=A0A1H1MU72_9MICO|nr:hypothetical protein SAMN04489719_1065 [Agrococcus carbonis]